MADSKFKYAYPGPPFHFLGHFAATQWDAFKEWQGKRQNFDDITLHHRIRAQQLRKTAGVLEQFYGNLNDQKLSSNFSKDIWKPGKNGHFNYAYEDDHIPMVVMSDIKARFKEQLQRDEEGVFAMNQVRCMVERHEDMAQFNYEFIHGQDANPNSPTTLAGLLSKIEGYFANPEYKMVLVNDKTDLYKGQPYARVNHADEPTQWELEQQNHSSADFPIGVVEQGAIEP